QSQRFAGFPVLGSVRSRPPSEITAGGWTTWKRTTSAPSARARVWATRNASSACAEKSVGTRILRIAFMDPSLLRSQAVLELPAGVLVHKTGGPAVPVPRGRREVLLGANLRYRVLDELVLEVFPEGGVLGHQGHVRLHEDDDSVVEPLDRCIVLHRVERKLKDGVLVVGDHHRNDLLSTFQPNMAHVLVR